MSFDELYSYLSGIFTLLYRTVPGTKERVGVSVHELAVATTEQCFIECDVNGRLSSTIKNFLGGFRPSRDLLLFDHRFYVMQMAIYIVLHFGT